MIPHTRQQLMVIWILWFSLFAAVFIYQFTLGGGVPTGSNARPEGFSPILVMVGVQLVAAFAIRWFLIPRADATGKLLVLMILGLSLSEAIEFYGIFLIPKDQPGTKLTLWILAIVSIMQFAPVYALTRNGENQFQTG